jgi:predicted ArsR family transcriptional regulator
MDATALAAAVGLHVTTARFHLDVLRQAGLIRVTTGRAGKPGRPRQLYSVTESTKSGQAYRRLAAALTEVLATDHDAGPRLAERAGRHWAQMELPAEELLSWDEGTRRVSELFARIGFAPRLVDDTAERHLELDACPFRDLARAYPQIVCRAHLGLLHGSLGRLGVPGAKRASIRPFVEPELCVADVETPSKQDNDPLNSG